MTSSRQELAAGIKAELPLLLGVIPFGLIYGVVARGAGLPPEAAQAMSLIVFAGTAQFVSAQLMGAGAPALVIFLSASLINLRHMLYSASVAPYLKKLSNSWKMLLAYLLTDEAYAVTIINYQQRGAGAHSHWYLLGAGLALWTTWQVSTLLGITLGAVVPASWSLDFTLALTFIALVVPAIKDQPSLLAALAAGITALLTANFPYKLGLLSATLVGILVGYWREME